MDHRIVYSKTGKGVLEIKNKAGKLSRELAKVLGLVDGKSSVDDLIAKSNLSEANVARVLKQLEDRGYVKEFSSLSGAMSSASSSGSSSYVDDLDFTKTLSPGKRIYSNSLAEMRARESADREKAEADARRERALTEERSKNQAAQKVREEAARLARIEAERKAKEAAALKVGQASERKKQQQASDMTKTTRDLAKILEAERRALEKSARQKKEDQAPKTKEESARLAKEEVERKRREAEERARAEEERKRREEEERARAEEEVASTGGESSDFDILSPSELEKSSMSSFDFPLEIPEVDVPSFDADTSHGFTANFDHQQELSREREEDERLQRQAAEDARSAIERASREEDALEQTVRRVALEAEMRARVEQEKLDRANRESVKREEYQRKVEQDDERKREEAARKEREHFERAAAERREREEAFARRRQQADESDRKRAELRSLLKSESKLPVERAKLVVVSVAVLVAVMIGVIQAIPMSGYIPVVEKMVSNSIGERVTIGSMKMSVLSGLRFKVGNVNIGATEDVRLTEVLVAPELGSLFGDKVVLNSVRVFGGTVEKEALMRMPAWLNTSMADERMRVRRLSLRGVKVEMQTIKLPTLNADVKFRRDGAIVSAAIETADRKLTVDIENDDRAAEVVLRASQWVLPIGAPLELSDFTGRGTIAGSGLNLSQWEATLYGGQAKGSAAISWRSRWTLTSQFEFAGVETEDLLAVFSNTAKASGSASARGTLSAQSASVDGLLDRPSVRASFTVKKGSLDGVDLVRALQSRRTGTRGGSTRFEELTGEVAIADGRFSYRNIELSAGILSARSNFNIASNQDLSGRVSVALRSPSQRLNANLNVSGNLTGATLRP
jgi:hypothetical protein